jgi:plastocyanin/sugar lactone lactonase YvrE
VSKGLLAVFVAVAASAALAAQAAAAPTTVSVYATGLFNPKGMAFGPDGALYVAESGPPGSVTVPLPTNFGGSGPIGTRASVARIEPGGGKAARYVTGLPNIGLYGGVEMLGAASLAYLHGHLYEVAAGHMTVSPKLSEIMPDGKLRTVADLGKFNDDNPPPAENGDAVPFGNPFSMVALGDKLYISDGNYNTIMEVTPSTGVVRNLVAFRPDPTTTGLAVGPDGKEIYVAQYGNAPYLPGSGAIDTVTPGGVVHKGVVKGVTTPIDTAFAKDGTMYVLQYAAKFDSKHLRYVVNTGGLFRIGKDGSKTPVVTHLMFPTDMTFGPDGALYVTDFGNEANFGEGEVLRIQPGDTAAGAPMVPEPRVHGTYDVPKTNETLAAGANVAGAVKLKIVEPKVVLKWGFSPTVVHAKVGQKIQVTNTGLISHTMTSVKGSFDTGLIRHNLSAVVVVNTPGTYKFICSPHPWMKGTLVVTGSGSGTGTIAEAPTAKVKSPSLNGFAVVLVFGGILLAVFGLAWFARRRPSEQ